MELDRDLDTTARYLRFPFVEDHRAPLQDGSRCPHCGARRVHKWGRFSGRQRFRCRECGRTFSTFTGTPLAYVKKPELWRRFLWCVEGRLTVRECAVVMDVDKNTALRWRHRLFEQWLHSPKPRLKGRIEIGGFSLPRSEKGSRSLSRPPRQRGEGWSPLPSLQTEPVMVLAAWHGPEGLILQSTGSRRAGSGEYTAIVSPRLGAVDEIVGANGRLSALGLFAVRLGVSYRRERVGVWPPQVFRLRRELRSWLRLFRGVSTRRLDGYLEWFRRRGAPYLPTLLTDRAGRWARPAGALGRLTNCGTSAGVEPP
jgi:transposase-like protein